MKQKILFISDHGDPLMPLGSKQAGGQNNYVKHLALSLDKLGYAVDVITHWCNQDAPAVEALGDHGKVYRFNAGRPGFVEKNEMFGILPAFYAEIKEKIDLESYDVIHTHYWLSGVLGLMIQKEYGVYWVHTNHSLAIAKEQGTGKIDPKRKHYEERIMQHADVVLATTPTEKELIAKFTKNVSDISVVPIGVSPTYLTPLLTAGTVKFPYYFYAGRLEASKGIFDLLAAFRQLLTTHDVQENIKLLIAGGCSETVDMSTLRPKDPKLLAALEGIEDRVYFLGPKKEKELKVLYGNAIATIMPSHYESFGMVAAEAQACGCPVIASEVGGLKDVVKPGVTGLHIPKAHANKLSEGMAYFLTKRGQLANMRRQAKEHAKNEFNWAKIAAKVNKLYKGAGSYVSTP